MIDKINYSTLPFARAAVNAANMMKLFDIYTLVKSFSHSHIVIIYYHKFKSKKPWFLPGISPKVFEKEMKYLKKMFSILSLEELVNCINEKKKLPKRLAIITFDDGYKDNYQYAFPILKKYQIPATLFITTGNINDRTLFWWDQLNYIIHHSKISKLNLNEYGKRDFCSLLSKRETYNYLGQSFNNLNTVDREQIISKLKQLTKVQIPPNIAEEFILSWDEIKEMSEYGINIGSHTVTHPILSKIPLENAKYEIQRSKKDIEHHINKKITSFCYPNGKQSDFNKDIIKIVKDSGYKCAVTTIASSNFTKKQLYQLGRFSTGWNYSSFKFSISKIHFNI